MHRGLKQTPLLLLAAAIVAGLFANAASAQGRASVSDIAGRPNAVIVGVPSDPCGFLYEQMPSRLRDYKLDLGPVNLDKRALFTHYCENQKDAIVAIVTASFADAQKTAEGELGRLTNELTAGFWKYIAEILYEQLPAEEQAKYSPGSPALDGLAHEWLNEASNEAATYAAAYLTAGGQESRIYNAWKTYLDITSGESRTIVGQMQGVLEVARKRLRQVVNAREELAEPDTSTIDALEKVGLSGAWIDNLKSYEGQLRGLNSSYRITDAMQIMSSAMGSEEPSDKVRAFFELMKVSGAITSESRAPMIAFVGDIIQQYAEAASAVLDSVIALESQIAERNGFCLGVGAPSRDPRHAYFIEQNVLACPLALGTWPFKHIYQSQGAGPARLFFYNGDGFTESTNGVDRNAIAAAATLIAGAIELGYPLTRDPDDHVARLAAVYNTSHPGGITALLEDTNEIVADIDAALSAVRQSHVAGDSCSEANVLAHIARDAGLSVENFRRDTAGGKDRLANAIAASFVAFEGGFGPGVNRGANAYETYQRLAEKLREQSMFILEGRILDQNRASVPGAFVDIRVSSGKEIRGCEAWQADGAGRFAVFAVGTLDMEIIGRAETAETRGEAEMFDGAYFRRVGVVTWQTDQSLVARASGEMGITVETDDDAGGDEEQQRSDDETGADDSGNGETTAGDETPPTLPAECAALTELVTRNNQLLTSDQAYSKQETRATILASLQAAQQAAVCDPGLIENATTQMQALDQAIQLESEISAALAACEPQAIAEKKTTLQGAPLKINSAQSRQLTIANAGLVDFEAGRNAYRANDLATAETHLNASLSKLRSLGNNTCAPFIERAEKGLAHIATIRSVGERLEQAASACDIKQLEGLQAAMAGKNHPAFDVYRANVMSTLRDCTERQAREAQKTACSAAEASLNKARANYRANKLGLAERHLKVTQAHLTGDAGRHCPEIAGRAERGLGNIATIRGHDANLADAIDRCDINRLNGLRSDFASQSHVWFREALGRADTAISHCESKREQQTDDVCDRIAGIATEVGAAFQAGEFQTALERVQTAEEMSRDAVRMVGCEGERQRIENAVRYFSTLVGLVAKSEVVLAVCEVDAFDGLIEQLGAYDHERVARIVSQLQAAQKDCYASAENREPTVESPVAPADTDQREIFLTGHPDLKALVEASLPRLEAIVNRLPHSRKCVKETRHSLASPTAANMDFDLVYQCEPVQPRDRWDKGDNLTLSIGLRSEPINSTLLERHAKNVRESAANEPAQYTYFDASIGSHSVGRGNLLPDGFSCGVQAYSGTVLVRVSVFLEVRASGVVTETPQCSFASETARTVFEAAREVETARR